MSEHEYEQEQQKEPAAVNPTNDQSAYRAQPDSGHMPPGFAHMEQPVAPVSHGVDRASAHVTSAWRWAMATLFLMPLLGFWALPSAGLTTLYASRGEVDAAASQAKTCRMLGIVAIGVGVLVFALTFFLVLASAAAIDDAATTST